MGFVVLSFYIIFMKVFVWNCRGAGNPNFARNFKNYIDLYKPDRVALLETKCSSNNAKHVC